MRTMNLTKRTLRAHRIHALLRLIHDEKIKGELAHPKQLVNIPAKIARALEPLQGLKRHHADLLYIRQRRICLAAENSCTRAQSLSIRDKGELTEPCNEAVKILRPRVRNARAIRHDQHLRKAHPADKIVRG